ncbi:hypothetical protein HUJ04_007300 [Dendroctonus ponderosae]|nr:hypothetical protein HUJ04_007300 [Dendroctonus ponderosae]
MLRQPTECLYVVIISFIHTYEFILRISLECAIKFHFGEAKTVLGVITEYSEYCLIPHNAPLIRRFDVALYNAYGHSFSCISLSDIYVAPEGGQCDSNQNISTYGETQRNSRQDKRRLSGIPVGIAIRRISGEFNLVID